MSSPRVRVLRSSRLFSAPLALVLALGCAGTDASELASLRAEIEALREHAWDVRRASRRADVHAEAARDDAAHALRAASRSQGVARELEPVPRAVRHRPLERVDRVIVRKAERRLDLYRGGEVLRSFRIALGFEPTGHKQHQGDGRTPEGRYTLTRQHTRRYGPGLHVSYPLDGDVARARAAGVEPGGAIFIHGLPLGLSVIGEDHAALDWTNGCIAVTDAQMEELWARVADGTPIEILP